VRLVLDTCVWKGAADELHIHGHDVVWVGDWPADPGDDEILAFALGESRVLVTLDKDFGELAVGLGHPHAGIVRLVDFPIRLQATACRQVLDRYGSQLEAGAIVTAERGRVRLRPAPSQDDDP
jgi:predicted nuclease of predicted toxin-antitoxin system